MLRLIRRRGAEGGAVAVIVAIVVGTFVLTGAAALTIDAGSLYAERRVVQNAADAASLALAQACAKGDLVKCSPTWGDLEGLANLNSPDGFTDIESVCGSVAPFTSCGTLPTNPSLVQCTKLPPTIPATAKWVEVRTKTHSTASNHFVVAKYFANLADPSYDGTGVKACARAAWGPVGAFSLVAPIAFSLCDYKAMITTDGYAAPPDPTYPNPIPSSVTSHETAIVVNDPGQTTDSNGCARWAGHILPGGFGYLNPDAGCNPTVHAGDWIHGKPGASVPSACKPVFDNRFNLAVWKRPVIFIPVFDCVSDHTKVCPKPTSGEDTYYRIKGLAAFYVTGSNLPSYNFPALTNTTRTACPSGSKCLFGWFTQGTLKDSGDTFGVEDQWYGVNKFKVAG